jgi:Sulfotransferase domain
MLGHIVASLAGVEKMSHHFGFDDIALLHWLGKVESDAAIAFLQTEADRQLYQQFLGREVNFRPGDTSSVWSNPFWGRYVKRLFSREGDFAMARLVDAAPMLHEATHDGLRSGLLFFAAFESRLRIVHIVRHPVDLVSDLLRRGFGTRVGIDPREFQFTFAGAQQPVHVYMADVADDISDFSAADFVAVTVAKSMRANLDGWLELPAEMAKWVRTVFFDDLCADPRSEVAGIADFLERQTTGATSRVIRREGLPRSLAERGESEENLQLQMSHHGRRALAESKALYLEFRRIAAVNSPAN